MEPVKLIFTSDWSAGVNLRRLSKAMQAEDHSVESIDTGEDYLITLIDGTEFSCDWKHNNFEGWASSFEGLRPGYRVESVSKNKLVLLIENPRSGMTRLLETEEKLQRAIQMFAPRRAS